MIARAKYISSASRRMSGFTLIELVIALGMVAIVAFTLAETLSIAYHSTREAESTEEPSRSVAIAMDYLSQDIQNSLPVTGTFANIYEGTQAQDDRGHEADDLVFNGTSHAPQHVAANGDIKKLEITVERNGSANDYVLVRRVSRNLSSDLSPAPDEEILCHGVDSLTLSYFDGSNWDQTWDYSTEDNQIPAAVKVNLVLERPGATAGQSRTISYTRIIPIPCSVAQFDANVNTGLTQ